MVINTKMKSRKMRKP